MAKFDDMSPSAIRGTRLFLENGDEVCKVSDGKTHPCWNCGEGTDWADFNFEAYLCSTECLTQKTKEYNTVAGTYANTRNTYGDSDKKYISSDNVK